MKAEFKDEFGASKGNEVRGWEVASNNPRLPELHFQNGGE